MKKIICLVRPHPPLLYFANTIHRRHPLALVIVEAKRRSWSRQAISRFRRLLQPGPRAEAGRLPADAVDQRHAVLYDRFFGDAWQALDPQIPLLVVPDINAPEVRARLAAERPDVLVDHGTSIVRDEVLALAPMALNVHWGLSPYYRGTRCTEWALINWDPYNIGVTIHELSHRIDGGGLIAQARVEIAPDDHVEAINMRLTQAGTTLMLEALDRIAKGQILSPRPQDHSQGLLTLNRQWSRPLRRQIRWIERHGAIPRMLKTPARKQRLPIVEFCD